MKLLERHSRRKLRMAPFDVDSFLASFESMIIWTQFIDSLYEANVHPHTMIMVNLKIMWRVQVQLMNNMVCLTTSSYTKVKPHSISDVRGIWNKHMDEPWVSYSWRSNEHDSRYLCMTCLYLQSILLKLHNWVLVLSPTR